MIAGTVWNKLLDQQLLSFVKQSKPFLETAEVLFGIIDPNTKKATLDSEQVVVQRLRYLRDTYTKEQLDAFAFGIVPKPPPHPGLIILLPAPALNVLTPTVSAPPPAATPGPRPTRLILGDAAADSAARQVISSTGPRLVLPLIAYNSAGHGIPDVAPGETSNGRSNHRTSRQVKKFNPEQASAPLQLQ